MSKLTETQRRGLSELAAASDEAIRLFDNDGWVTTFMLSGTKEDRSSANMHSLCVLGLAESNRHGGSNKQSRYSWRITPAGRAALTEADK